MKPFTKLLVLGAALAVSTSMAYADTLGVGTVSVSGLDKYNDNSITFGEASPLVAATGSLGAFAGTSDTVKLYSISSISGFTGADLFSVYNGADTLVYFLSSITSYSPSTAVLNGMGYLTEYAGTTLTDPIAMNPIAGVTLTSQGQINMSTTFSGTASITPEPSSLLLLGTGLLSAAGIARRKFAAKFV